MGLLDYLKPSTRTFSITDNLIVIGVVPIVTFNEAIAEYDSVRWEFKEGVNNELACKRRGSNKGSITVTVPQTTIINDGLNLTYATGAVVPVFVKDLMGLTTFAMKGIIVKQPPIKRALNPEDCSWRIEGEVYINILGGSLHRLFT